MKQTALMGIMDCPRRAAYEKRNSRKPFPDNSSVMTRSGPCTIWHLVSGDFRREASPVDELHCEVFPSSVFGYLINGNYIWVIEVRGGFSFGPKSSYFLLTCELA